MVFLHLLELLQLDLQIARYYFYHLTSDRLPCIYRLPQLQLPVLEILTRLLHHCSNKDFKVLEHLSRHKPNHQLSGFYHLLDRQALVYSQAVVN